MQKQQLSLHQPNIWPTLGMAKIKACWRQSQEPLVESESLVKAQRENNKTSLPATITTVVFCTRSHSILLSPIVC